MNNVEIEQNLYKETSFGLVWWIRRPANGGLSYWTLSQYQSVAKLCEAHPFSITATEITGPLELSVQISLGLLPAWIIDAYRPNGKDRYYLVTYRA